jgi:hypothetical protein
LPWYSWNIAESGVKHQKSNQPIEKSLKKIDTLNTQIHDLSISWSDTSTSIKIGGDKLFVCAWTSPPS